jgi:endonuclease/exonuclease/phosphatase (EEP) superfamily protein YafD
MTSVMDDSAQQPIKVQPRRNPWATVGWVLLIATAAATALATFAAHSWLGDLAVHFRGQYACVALLAGGLLLVGRRTFAAAAAGLVLLFNAYGFVDAHSILESAHGPTLVPRAMANPAPAVGSPLALRVAAVNVFFGNDDYDAVLDWVRLERPDIVSFEEVTPEWEAMLEKLAADYPHRLTSTSNGRFVTALFSRHPLEESTLLHTASNRDREIATVVRVGQRRVRVLAVHATWPFGPEHSATRDAEFAGLAAYAREHDEPVVIIGDFNVSPLSPHFRRTLLDEGGLKSAAVGFGWQPTWPTFLPIGGIQIDHVLVSPSIAVRDFRRGPRVGSDHRPIAADLQISF